MLLHCTSGREKRAGTALRTQAPRQLGSRESMMLPFKKNNSFPKVRQICVEIQTLLANFLFKLKKTSVVEQANNTRGIFGLFVELVPVSK